MYLMKKTPSDKAFLTDLVLPEGEIFKVRDQSKSEQVFSLMSDTKFTEKYSTESDMIDEVFG